MEYATFEGDDPGRRVRRRQRDASGTTARYECEKWSDREVRWSCTAARVSGRYVLFQTGARDRDWMIHRMDPPRRPGRADAGR